MTMPYWVGFQAQDGSQHVNLQRFDSYDDAMRYRGIMRREPNSSVSSVTAAETEEEARRKVKYYMLGLQDD